MDDKIETTAEAVENNQRPKARAVHADPDAPASPEQRPLPDSITRTPVEDKSPAEWAYERLILYIQNFEEQLDNDQEVAIGFTGGHSGILSIEGVGYFDPDIITFYGTDEFGARTQLVQHVSQLNVMLRALPIGDEAPEPRRIGFRLAANLDQDDAAASSP